MGKAISTVRRAAATADLIEIRLDSILRGDEAKLFRLRGKPLLFTCRRAEESGGRRISEEDRIGLLRRVLRDSPHLVDIEWDVPSRVRRRFLATGRAILSRHDFHRTPGNLPAMIGKLRRLAGRGVPVKLVTTASTLSDCLRVREALKGAEPPVIHFAMGDRGTPSRLLALSWGSLLTYGAAVGGKESAPGQPSTADLASLYRVKELSADPPLYAVAGSDPSRSLSPFIHNTLFRKANRRAIYVAAPGSEFRRLAKALDRLGCLGISVTAPFKAAAFRMAVEVSDTARFVGAANTLVRRPFGWFADNTDLPGFSRALARRMRPMGKRALVIGAGGAARACVAALARAGARVFVTARRVDAARRLEPLGAAALPFTAKRLAMEPFQLYVNATSSPDPLPGGFFREAASRGTSGRLAMDLSYGEPSSMFLRRAEAAGFAREDGLRMLFEQAMLQAELFLGEAPARRARLSVWRLLRSRAGVG